MVVKVLGGFNETPETLFYFSCHGDPNQKRNRLIMPSITTSRIYIVDVESDPRAPRIHKVRITKELRSSESPWLVRLKL